MILLTVAYDAVSENLPLVLHVPRRTRAEFRLSLSDGAIFHPPVTPELAHRESYLCCTSGFAVIKVHDWPQVQLYSVKLVFARSRLLFVLAP